METIKPTTIFLVDDDPVFLGLIEKTLAKNKTFNIKTFPVGELCLDNLHHNPDIIILDYHLNSKYEDADNGLKLLKEIRAKNCNTSVIMLSGQDDIGVAVESIKNGAYDYIIKNQSSSVRLQHAIQKIISLNKISKENKSYKNKFILFTIILSILLGFIIFLSFIKPALF